MKCNRAPTLTRVCLAVLCLAASAAVAQPVVTYSKTGAKFEDG